MQCNATQAQFILSQPSISNGQRRWSISVVSVQTRDRSINPAVALVMAKASHNTAFHKERTRLELQRQRKSMLTHHIDSLGINIVGDSIPTRRHIVYQLVQRRSLHLNSTSFSHSYCVGMNSSSEARFALHFYHMSIFKLMSYNFLKSIMGDEEIKRC